MGVSRWLAKEVTANARRSCWVRTAVLRLHILLKYLVGTGYNSHPTTASLLEELIGWRCQKSTSAFDIPRGF